MLPSILKLFRAPHASQATAPAAAPAPKPAADKPRDRRKLKRARRRASLGVVRIDADGPLLAQARQARGGKR